MFELSTIADVERAYKQVMAELPAQDYAGTEFSELVERQLSDDMALVTGAGAWTKSTGERFMPFGIRRSRGSWRIVVAAIHE